MSRFASVQEVHTLVERFERCELARSEWTHEAHLTVAVCHALRYAAAEGDALISRAIRRFNAHHGVEQTPTGGYHETITRFYMHVVRQFLANAPDGMALDALVNAVLTEFGDRAYPLRYYSKDLLFSWEARTSWVAPDLRSLDGAATHTAHSAQG